MSYPTDTIYFSIAGLIMRERSGAKPGIRWYPADSIHPLGDNHSTSGVESTGITPGPGNNATLDYQTTISLRTYQ